MNKTSLIMFVMTLGLSCRADHTSASLEPRSKYHQLLVDFFNQALAGKVFGRKIEGELK